MRISEFPQEKCGREKFVSCLRATVSFPPQILQLLPLLQELFLNVLNQTLWESIHDAGIHTVQDLTLPQN